ncbi:primosomal replication protein PriB/PriC domain protein [Edwardsiella tarda]|uniref:primosomal replication protein PriB/PriC domain protein n=1 Tax=Edwardsiella TaxID=635 RepID=UPI00083AF522|nr:primosomal replication protein PriB/PriC domain protein [Edwardsiella tarda]
MSQTQRAILQALYDDYIQAEHAVLKGRSITLNGQSMTMENLAEIRKGREQLARQLQDLTGRRPLYRTARFS